MLHKFFPPKQKKKIFQWRQRWRHDCSHVWRHQFRLPANGPKFASRRESSFKKKKQLKVIVHLNKIKLLISCNTTLRLRAPEIEPKLWEEINSHRCTVLSKIFVPAYVRQLSITDVFNTHKEPKYNTFFLSNPIIKRIAFIFLPPKTNLRFMLWNNAKLWIILKSILIFIFIIITILPSL